MRLGAVPIVPSCLYLLLSFVVAAESMPHNRNEHSSRQRAVPTFGVQLTSPQQLSLSVAAIISTDDDGFHHSHHGSIGAGVLVQAEPGLGGGKLSVGYGHLVGMASWEAKLTALRTWGDPWGADPNETYLGPEVVARFSVFKLGIGALFRVDGGDERWIATASFGVGF